VKRPSRRELFGAAGTPRIVIVGAGFAGIGLAVRLKKAAIDSFTIYDMAESVGGAWWYNQYPGAEVDTVSYVYSFPFKRHAWSRTHAKQPELLKYLNETVDEFGVRRHLRLGVAVEAAAWDDAYHVYRLRLSTGENVECHVLVGATGFLNIPKYPTWLGLESFQGPKFHTARWEPQHDLTGKTVAVVGTGSSGSQVVPELARVAGRLYVFQREPGWVVHKLDRDHEPDERARMLKPWQYRMMRLKWFWGAEKMQWDGGLFRAGAPLNTMGQQAALKFISKELGDRPDLEKMVTPDYPYWGKRLIMNTTFYAALKRDNVELIPRAVVSVTPTGVVDEDGVERRIDVLVMATGFQTGNYLGTMEVRGRGDRNLREVWAGEPKAFLGITVPGFPNFFILYGPGTNGGEIASMLMRQAEFVVRAVKGLMRQRVTAVEVRPTWADTYQAWLQSNVNNTVWAKANNYYRGDSGTIVTQWPFSPGRYGLLVRILGRASGLTSRREVKPKRPAGVSEEQSELALEE
jgi:cation diffusion facilitator CzcD-associated flavoprotein CzcO